MMKISLNLVFLTLLYFHWTEESNPLIPMTTFELGNFFWTTFRNATFLTVNGVHQKQSNYQTVVQQPVSDPVHPGDSVTLQCSVLSETCTDEHSVYWFRSGSGESYPGVIYTLGNHCDECEKSPKTPSSTQSCVYSLSKNNLSPSDAGTYYCAVATCGEILFGKGTILEIERSLDPLVVVLGGTLIVCVILILILICTRNTKPDCEHCKVISSEHVGHDNLSSQFHQDQNADSLNYVAITFSGSKRNRGQKNSGTPQEAVYSDVKFSQQK
ncbi:hypothetical protein DPEC_G00018290 [Dallia pectoralis]|uniref:Uncharacterized protein n=1 Tax=Dallia pectoralis TaxID=75939 RepID=A0ACC2HFQ5_DALPE|nr:hypothetical protein DPEC_G00018290 [Dallia pectoralis]